MSTDELCMWLNDMGLEKEDCEKFKGYFNIVCNLHVLVVKSVKLVSNKFSITIW